MVNYMNKRLGLIGLMLLIWAMGLLIYAMYQLTRPLMLEEPVVVSFEKGRSLSSFFVKLENENIIDDGRWVMVVAKLSGKARRAKAGDYKLDNSMSSLDAVSYTHLTLPTIYSV